MMLAPLVAFKAERTAATKQGKRIKARRRIEPQVEQSNGDLVLVKTIMNFP